MYVCSIARTYYVYIAAGNSKVIYTGLTNKLEARIYQHKNILVDGFSKWYNTYKLVWSDETDDIGAEIELEKRIKGWLRKKKIALIEKSNPG